MNTAALRLANEERWMVAKARYQAVEVASRQTFQWAGRLAFTRAEYWRSHRASPTSCSLGKESPGKPSN